MPTNVSPQAKSALIDQVKQLHAQSKKDNTSVKSTDIAKLADDFKKAGYDTSTGAIYKDLRILFDQTPDQLNSAINGGKTTGAIGGQWATAMEDLVAQVEGTATDATSATATPATAAATEFTAANIDAAVTAGGASAKDQRTAAGLAEGDNTSVFTYAKEQYQKVVNDPKSTPADIGKALASAHNAYNDPYADPGLHSRTMKDFLGQMSAVTDASTLSAEKKTAVKEATNANAFPDLSKQQTFYPDMGVGTAF